MLGDHSAETFKPLWAIVGAWQCYFYVTDGWSVYPGFIPPGDQIVSKTYMTRVEGENTRLRHYPCPTPSQDIVLFQVRRNAETFNPLVTALLKILGCPDSCLIPPSIQQCQLINGKSVERQIFQRICACLEVDFRAIAGLQPPADRNPSAATGCALGHALTTGPQVSSQDGSSQSSLNLNLLLLSQSSEPTVEPAAALIGDGFSAEPGYKSAPQPQILGELDFSKPARIRRLRKPSKVQASIFDGSIQQLEERLQGSVPEVEERQNWLDSILLSLRPEIAEKFKQILKSDAQVKIAVQRHLRSSPGRRALPPGQE